MKTLLFAPLLALTLISERASAAYNRTAPDSVRSATMEARLSYRFFPDAHRAQRYTLAMEHTREEAATLRLLTQDGIELYNAKVKQPSLLRHFDLRYLSPGMYVLQIGFGNQVREETFRID